MTKYSRAPATFTQRKPVICCHWDQNISILIVNSFKGALLSFYRTQTNLTLSFYQNTLYEFLRSNKQAEYISFSIKHSQSECNTIFF